MRQNHHKRRGTFSITSAKLIYRVERSAVFSDSAAHVTVQDADALASLNQLFNFDINSYLHSTTSQSSPNQPVQDPIGETTEFNLFSTTSELVKVSLTQPVYEVPLINRTRPKEYYFTDPYCPLIQSSNFRNDKRRMSKLVSVAVTASELIASSREPWVCAPLTLLTQAAKRNPRLLTTIPAHPEKIKKRRRPSKKERDYKKKIKLEEEKKARDERRYEKFLKFGQGHAGSRGHAGRGRGRDEIRGTAK
jgi:hypothetical protein